MKLSNWRTFGFIACVIAVITFSVSASDGSETFVVSASPFGDANYMTSDPDGTLSSAGSLPFANANGLSGNSFGNAIGDFDNDGNLDYIMGIGDITGIGVDSGKIYVFKKIGSGNQFDSPIPAASWTEGRFPMDMAVADFDEDGNQDFVLSFLYSSNCGLYMGDGSLGFKGLGTDPDPVLLQNAAEYFSAGADAADFNGDGHADFIIAPYASGQFYVHLGNGAGAFQTSPFSGKPGVAYHGVAVANFDTDGIVDLAASYNGYIDIYFGNSDGTFGIDNGDGTFDYDHRITDNGIHLSLLDAYDFNGDGNQDLVAANFGPAMDGIAIYLGLGNGSFQASVTYWGENSGPSYAISAPPGNSNNEPNKEPVAVVNPGYLEVIVGEEIVVDGSESYDEDGEIVNYAWDFGDAKPAAMLQTVSLMSDTKGATHEVSSSHIYNEAGSYAVTLTVTDDKGATASVQAEVHVSDVPVVPVKVKFSPRKLNLRSRQKWIWATIKVPAGYDARQIDDSSVCVLTDDAFPIFANSDYGRGFLAKVRKRVYRKKRSLTLRFDRQDVIKAVGNRAGKFRLNIEGQIFSENGWSKLEGSGKIKTIVKKKKGYYYKLRKKQIKRIMKHLARKWKSKKWKCYWR